MGEMGGGFKVQSSWGQRGRESGERVELPHYLVEKKLLTSLVEPARRLRYRLPDGRRLKRLYEGWLGSPTMLVALRVETGSVDFQEGGE